MYFLTELKKEISFFFYSFKTENDHFSRPFHTLEIFGPGPGGGTVSREPSYFPDGSAS